MRPAPFRLALALAFVAPLACGGLAFAEEGPPPPPAGWHDHPGMDPAKRAEHIEEILQLRPDQQPALQAFLAAVHPEGEMKDQPPGQGGGPEEGLTAPQRMDRMVARLDAARARLAQVDDATKRFYAQLTPSQQKAFDDLMPLVAHRMMAHWRHGPDGDGDHGRWMGGDHDGPPPPEPHG